MESADGVSIDPRANQRPYSAMDSQSDELSEQMRQLVPVNSASVDDDDQVEDSEAAEKGHLAIPEIIETLKNLAACKEKLFKWEQSVSNLESIPDSDPNKNHLMEIIDFVENNKSSTKEKAIYLYEQLGLKCRQHKNYIGAAKAFERAASLRLDISDLNENGDNREAIVTSTIRYLESAIDNYDAIHKFKHAGTLHYRCSKILKMMNASHEEVDKHHEKALEYFTKPHHELKHRKRIDGIKISCYSSYSTLARMHHEIEKFTHTTTTTTTNTIKFHSDSYHSEDSDSNHSTTPPPSSSGSANGPLTPAIQFYGEDRNQEYHHPPADNFFDSFMEDGGFVFDQPPSRAAGTSAGKVRVGSSVESASGPSGQGAASREHSSQPSANSGAPMSGMLEKTRAPPANTANRHHSSSSSSSHHFASHHESLAAVKDHHHHYHHHLAKSSAHHSRHLQSGPSGSSAASSSSYSSFAKSHHKSSISSSLASATLPHSSSSLSSSLSAALHASQALHKTTFRCIEDRIESARKLVKKLHKLCPFYEVSTNGDDAGRVYCRICDRFLGAVSSTLKNHVNTQEHRQAYEDSQQPPGTTTTGSGAAQGTSSVSNSASGTALASAAAPAVALPGAHSQLTVPVSAATSSSVSTQLNSSYQQSTANPSQGNQCSDGSLANYAPSHQSSVKPNYGNTGNVLQQGSVALSPFMLPQATNHSLPYQPSMQSLDGALQKSAHISAKYMDFEMSGPNGNLDASMQLNSSSWQANQNAGGAQTYSSETQPQQQQQQQQYLFGNVPNSMSLNNLLTFTDAVVNGAGGSGGISTAGAGATAPMSSKQAMAALMQGHPHYAIPSSTSSNITSNGTPSNAPVLAYQ